MRIILAVFLAIIIGNVNPILLSICIGILIGVAIYKPIELRDTFLGRVPPTKPRKSVEKKEEDGFYYQGVFHKGKGFTTLKEMQERAMADIKWKPGYQEDPKVKEMQKRIQNLMDRNRKIAQKEMQDEIEKEAREGANRMAN